METKFTILDYDIEMKSSATLALWFWGDLHKDTKAFDGDRFKWFLKKSGQDETRRYIGMGDYFDFASAKEQRKLIAAELHETTMESFDMRVEEKNRGLAADVLKVMGGRVIGLIGGNHSWKLSNGKMADEDLAERLKTKYLGWLSLIRVHIYLTDRKKTMELTIAACHGKSGGRLFGTSVNQVMDLKKIFPLVNIYAMAHDHKKYTIPDVSLTWTSIRPTKLRQFPQRIVRTGSFMKSYEEDTSSYTIGGLLAPVPLGAPKINVSFHRDNKNGDNLTMDMEGVS